MRSAFITILAASTLAVLAQPARANDTSFAVKQIVGNGSVTGQIVTDGKTGTLSQSNIKSWNLVLTGPGASTTLTTGSSSIVLVGSDVNASNKTLTFNYSGTDGGYLLFQPSLYSGTKYWCNNTTWYGCRPGVSVVPQSFGDASAQYMALTGTGTLGTAMMAVSEDELYASVLNLAFSRTAQMLVNQSQTQALLGVNDQVSCGNCGGSYLTIGSAALSSHGRVALTPEWTLLGGGTLGTYAQRRADVTLDAGLAGALRFDPANFGGSRPYAEAGVSASYQDIRYHRRYTLNDTLIRTDAQTHGYNASAYVRGGWVDRITPRDEAAVSLTYSHLWQGVARYTEKAGDANPFDAFVPSGTDTLDMLSVNGQATHLFVNLLGHKVEADANAGANWAYNAHSGLKASIATIELQGQQPSFVYYSLGGRLGVRLSKTMTLDLFANSILAPKKIGSSLHGGVGVKWVF